jgi:hypothetical protein
VRYWLGTSLVEASLAIRLDLPGTGRLPLGVYSYGGRPTIG